MDSSALITEPAWLVSSLGWIEAHPLPAMLLLALSTAVEGLFLVGMVIPGSLLMFAAGAIAVAGEIPLWPVLLIAALGAWLGDCASFALGRWQRHRLPHLAQRWRIPGTIARAERFFAHHGGKSVLLGRFIGPLRPLVPAIAGAAGMPAAQFLLIDLIAALLWAPAYALPGVLVGATLSLAAEVASRLALLLGLVLLGAFLIWWLIVQMMRLSARYAEPALGRLMDWSHRHRRLGNLGPGLADPHQPETPVLLVSLATLLGLSWLIGHLLWQWPGPLHPPPLDAAAYDWVAALLSAEVAPLVRGLQALSSPGATLSLGVGLLAMLILLRRPRAAAHWSAGIVGGLLLGLSLPGGGTALGPGAVLEAGATTALWLCLLCTLVGLLATGRRPASRILLYSATGTLLGLVLLSRLAAGSLSLSQLLLVLSVSLIWSSLLILGYRRHLRGARRLPLLASLGVAGLLLGGAMTGMSPRAAPTAFDWAQTPPARVNLLWQGEAADIRNSLTAAGWRPLPATEQRDYLNWLSLGDETRAELPPAPRWLAGQRPALRFTRAQPALLLRLWPSQTPGLWLGQIGERRLQHWAGLLRVPVTRHSDAALEALATDLGPAWRRRPGSPDQAVLVIEPAG